MATNRTKRQRKSNQLIVCKALFYYFETGDSDQSQFDEADSYSVFLEFVTDSGPNMIDYWEVCRDEVINTWIKNFPCTRPFGWWQFETTEPRRRISGPKPDCEIWGITPHCRKGIPSQWVLYQMDCNSGRIKADVAVYESEAAYLQRLDLLTPSEQKWLVEHQELLSPVEVEIISN